jgi:hypothetical protein
MKKIISTVALLAITFTGFAQDDSSSEYKPKKGTITTEVGLVGGLNNANFNLNEGTAKFRYFFKDAIAFRLGLGIASQSTTNSNPQTAVPPATPVPITTDVTKFSSKLFSLGVEKHFKGSDRLSTYAGFDLLLGFVGSSAESSTDNGTFANLSGATDIVSGRPVNRSGSEFGVRITTGADYYIVKKVYLGVELGLSYISSSSDAVTSSIKSLPTGPVVDTNLFAKGKGSGTNTQIIGGVKIGYQF